MTNQGYPHPSQPGGFYGAPSSGEAPRRPAVLELAAGTWAAVAVLFWLLGAMASEGAILASLIFGAILAAIFLFGCWKVRSGSNGWRVFFTIISGCYAVLVPFGLLDPEWGIDRKALSVLIGALCVVGLVCSWLPASNRYYRDNAEYRRARKAQQFAEFVRDNPPPESLRRKMFSNQPPQPPIPPGPPSQNEPPHHS
ncbi:FUSC family protein [Saccharopolyspora spinosa]|nr:FUSC family protein [Saccharopolyspora spinosa]